MGEIGGHDLKKSLLTICELLKEHEVSYMLVGGTAVALNGYYRHSIDNVGKITPKPDIDLWFNPTYQNYFRILAVIKRLGRDISDFENEKCPNPKSSFFRLTFDDFTLDILPSIKAEIPFIKADQRKEIIQIDGIPIIFMGLDDLIKDKEATGRLKDIEDINHLRERNK